MLIIRDKKDGIPEHHDKPFFYIYRGDYYHWLLLSKVYGGKWDFIIVKYD
jgi:hypothetical protein